jgi:hypothetical protein
MRSRAVIVSDPAYDDTMLQDATLEPVAWRREPEADALAEIAASWLDESERTSVMEPDIVLHGLSEAGWDHAATTHYDRAGSRVIAVPAAASSNDSWDDLYGSSERAFDRLPEPAVPARASKVAAKNAPGRRPGSTTIPARMRQRAVTIRPPVLPALARATPAQYPAPVHQLPAPRAHATHVLHASHASDASAHISGSRPRVVAADLRDPRLGQPSRAASAWQVPDPQHGVEAQPRRSLPPRKSAWSWPVWVLVPACTALLAANAVWVTRNMEPSVLATEPAATIPRASETGFWLVSNPAGAEISIDGKSLGRVTPARISEVSPGLHAIELKRTGYLNSSLAATSLAGELVAVPSVALYPASEPVRSPSVPARSPSVRQAQRRAHVDATRVRRGALRRRILPAVPASEARSIDESAPSTAARESGDAAPAMGMLRINSRPWARIEVDGRFVGNTPQRALELEPGQHVVKLVNEPMRMSKTLDLTIQTGQTLTRVEMLDED